jgi:adenosylmethionine-8-amino-7-oxononanoate aminotransferase
MGGVLVRDTIHGAFMSGPEHIAELAHGYTYSVSAHPLACAGRNLRNHPAFIPAAEAILPPAAGG